MKNWNIRIFTQNFDEKYYKFSLDLAFDEVKDCSFETYNVEYILIKDMSNSF